MMEYDNIRTSFHKKIGTDESVGVDLMVNAPSKKRRILPGSWYGEEKVAWFKNKAQKRYSFLYL